ncbi:MAG: hypothetical protein HQL93_04160 [Magnetococcales bacterium]|nr:hypothetical protein [Magnetococcales bacterium]
MFNNISIQDPNTNLTERFDYNGLNQIVYRGTALPGTAETEPGWAIYKYDRDASMNVISKKMAVGELNNFSHIWANRASLEYV